MDLNATALRLASEGAVVALMGRRESPLRDAAAEIATLGGRALVLPCDIADQLSLSKAMQVLADDFGELNGLFANAGTLGEFRPVVDTSDDQLEQLIRTNLKGTLATIKHGQALMAAGGAMVINASWTAHGVMPGAGVYAATKGALLSLTKTLAVEQGQRGIRVNAISPGIILTPMASDVLDPVLAGQLAKQAALKRNGTPEDVTGTVAWLLSEDAAFVTGQNIVIDGGYTLGGVRL